MYELDHTNTELIASFQNQLTIYEAGVVPESTDWSDYRDPANAMTMALRQIVSASQADTLSMMRYLMDRVIAGINDLYSDFTISMLATAANDDRAKQLIYCIVYSLFEIASGESIEFNDNWFPIVNNNVAIFEFMMNFAMSDQAKLEETYSGNIIVPEREFKKLEVHDQQFLLKIGYGRYSLKLLSNELQTLNLTVHPEVHRDPSADPKQKLIIVSEVVVTPAIGSFILDKSVRFQDDAAIQASALRCVPQGYAPGADTCIFLPDIFYSASLHVVSYNAGETWTVTEINVLPPSTTSSR